MSEHYRFRKVTPKMKVVMKDLRDSGMSYRNISKVMGISQNVASYHLNERTRENTIKRAQKFNKKKTKNQIKENNEKRASYRANYQKDRYHNDESFRKSFVKMVSKSFKKRREKWKKKGLCSQCGGEKIDKQFLRCEECRERSRK